MTKKVALVTNVKEYAGSPTAAAYAEAGWNVFCHDDSFISKELCIKYEWDNPGRYASNAQDKVAFVMEGIERFGKIDALVSNDIPKNDLGEHASASSMLEGGDRLAGFEGFVASLLIEPVRLLRAAIPTMKAALSGSIVLVTSGSPLRSPPMTIAHGYPAARAAANFLTKSLAAELAPFTIQVNAVAPFLLYSQTMFPSDIGADDPIYSPVVQQLVPMQRFGTPEELGALILRLTSGEMHFVSGQVIAFSGAAC